MTALTPEYLAEAIADEITLAKLLGYKPITPSEITPSVTIWASKGSSFASFSGSATRQNGAIWLPKWRRGNDAFELIARCQMSLLATELSAQAGCPGGTLVIVQFSKHPTPDHAIRYAMCKAAIAYLTAEQSKERGA